MKNKTDWLFVMMMVIGTVLFTVQVVTYSALKARQGLYEDEVTRLGKLTNSLVENQMDLRKDIQDYKCKQDNLIRELEWNVVFIRGTQMALLMKEEGKYYVLMDPGGDKPYKATFHKNSEVIPYLQSVSTTTVKCDYKDGDIYFK